MAVAESHPFVSQSIDIWSLNAAAKATEIGPARIVEQNEDNIGWGRAKRSVAEEKKDEG